MLRLGDLTFENQGIIELILIIPVLFNRDTQKGGYTPQLYPPAIMSSLATWKRVLSLVDHFLLTEWTTGTACDEKPTEYWISGRTPDGREQHYKLKVPEQRAPAKDVPVPSKGLAALSALGLIAHSA